MPEHRQAYPITGCVHGSRDNLGELRSDRVLVGHLPKAQKGSPRNRPKSLDFFFARVDLALARTTSVAVAAS